MNTGKLLLLLEEEGPLTWRQLRERGVTTQHMNIAHYHQLIDRTEDPRLWAITDTGRKAIP